MTEFASGQKKPNPIPASSWFPAVVPLEKKISIDHEITLPLSSGSIKTQTFGSKKALEGKKRELGFAYFSTGKIRTLAPEVLEHCLISAQIRQGVYQIVELLL